MGATFALTGTRTLDLNFDSHPYRWKFTIADVAQPILGDDFLHGFSLLVDVRGGQMVPVSDLCPAKPRKMFTLQQQLDEVAEIQQPFAALLAEFPGLLTPQFMAWSTTFLPRAHRFMPACAASRPLNCASHETSSSLWRT